MRKLQKLVAPLVLAMALVAASAVPASAASLKYYKTMSTTGARVTFTVSKSGVGRLSVLDTKRDGKSAFASIWGLPNGSHNLSNSKGVGSVTGMNVAYKPGTHLTLDVCTFNASGHSSHARTGCKTAKFTMR
ncbi:hypothetical protein G7068_01375 [Leucobacter viscericola]|uniref:Uncharacterized protein n=1 Tax=Leucobacter viscericola TaxID=2714935 RepID=A0A6G7XBN1_9MICO|nr:hypothetical protein [Leucobacter viscericola]QIK62004.1 hypothetical protein G7068_01375 [Leucobacter viscericola]